MKAKIAAASERRQRDRQDDVPEGREDPGAVERRRPLEAGGNADEEAAQDPDHDRQIEGQIDQAEIEHGIDEAELADRDEQRDGDGDAGKHLRREDQEGDGIGARDRSRANA